MLRRRLIRPAPAAWLRQGAPLRAASATSAFTNPLNAASTSISSVYCPSLVGPAVAASIRFAHQSTAAASTPTGPTTATTTTTATPTSVTPGATLPGVHIGTTIANGLFTCEAVTPLPGPNLTVYRFYSATLGTSLYHIACDPSVDPSQSFCIGFATPAQNNGGGTHVLEHMTLCGSEKYETVRDPFFKMQLRSFSTFMNALTGPEFTLYPFASPNRQDFKNLLSVYLDAVFRPKLRAEDFLQEGHRVELEQPAEAAAASTSTPQQPTESSNNTATETTTKVTPKFTGTVFNEMKGVVSQPSRYFQHEVLKEMLPTTHYQYVSGGKPMDILDLTVEDVRATHRRSYHPSNSVTFVYGGLRSVAPSSTGGAADVSASVKEIDAWYGSALGEYFSSFQRPVDAPPLPTAARPTTTTTTTAGDAVAAADRHPFLVRAPRETSFFPTVPSSPSAPPPVSPRSKTIKIPAEPMGDVANQSRVLFVAAVPDKDMQQLRKEQGGTEEAKGATEGTTTTSYDYRVVDSLQGQVEWSVADSLLRDGPASPMYQALLGSQLGSRYASMSGAALSLTTPTVGFGVTGASPVALHGPASAQDVPAATPEGTSASQPSTTAPGAGKVEDEGLTVEQTVLQTLQEVLQSPHPTGFDPKRVEAVLFQNELSQRHRVSSFGVNLCIGLAAQVCTKPTLTEPETMIDWIPHLQQLRHRPERIKTTVEGMSWLLSRYGKRFVAHADKQIGQQDEQVEKQLLEQRTKDWMQDEVQIKERLQRHKEWLAYIRTPQDESVLPTMTKADIPLRGFVEPTWVPMGPAASTKATSVTSGSASWKPSWVQSAPDTWVIPTATNGIVYFKLFIPYGANGGVRLSTEGPSPLTVTVPTGDAASGAAGGAASTTITIRDQKTLNLPNLNLAHDLLTLLGTPTYAFDEWETEVSLCSSGLSVSHAHGFASGVQADQEGVVSGTYIGFYTTLEQFPRALSLLQEVLTEDRLAPTPTATAVSKLSEAEKNFILTCIKSSAQSTLAGITNRGNSYAVKEAGKSVSLSGYLSHVTGGVDALQEASNLLQALSMEESAAPGSMSPSITDALIEQWLSLRTTYLQELRSRLALGRYVITCDATSVTAVESQLMSFQSVLGRTAAANGAASVAETSFLQSASWKDMTKTPAAAGSKTSVAPAGTKTTFGQTEVSQVPLNVQTSFAGATISTGLMSNDEDHHHLRLAVQVLQSRYLHSKIREEGGAYGCAVNPSAHGIPGCLQMSSYRDPAPWKSIGVFESIPDWLGGRKTTPVGSAAAGSAPTVLPDYNITETEVDEARVRLFASLDAPYCPSEFGTSLLLHGLTAADSQRNRDILLRAQASDVRNVARYFEVRSASSSTPVRHGAAIVLPAAAPGPA